MAKKQVSVNDVEEAGIAKENRKYKDSVFTDLFYSDITAEENQVALYNALHGTDYSADSIEMGKIALENILYMNFKNDTSWNMDNKCLIFTEHQSTINRNMCVRFLMYVGRTYEKMIPVKVRYGKKQVAIIRPEFYVLYNGIEDFPLEDEMKLSDSYVRDESEDIDLELTVHIININLDKHHPILDKCPILKDYMKFVEIVRKHKRRNEEDAMRQAIQESIQSGILAEYLLRKGSEVCNMLIAEYDYQMDIQVQREEAEEDGLARGLEIGRAEGLADIIIPIIKKLKKGRNLEQIADELEMEMDLLMKYMEVITKYAPDYDVDAIVHEIIPIMSAGNRA